LITRILEKFHVASLAINLPGPLAVARLRDMGAAVRKIEPLAGDPLELVCPEWYRSLHQGIEVFRLDLKDAGQRGRLNKFLESTDLLVTASRLASLERLGLGWEQLHARFPRLSHLAIVGNAPPNEHRPGHDLLYQAEHGLVIPPELPVTCVADLAGALEAVIAALQLLLANPEGSQAIVGLADAAAWFAEPLRQGLTTPSGILGGGFAGYNLYPTKDGWIALAALEPHFQQALLRTLDIAELASHRLQEVFLTRTADEWAAWARTNDVPLVKVNPTSPRSGTDR
jgi:crotonobetainyl-CoA:carnitine CoA-transferase CaiB-like acyl-CoA transferase